MPRRGARMVRSEQRSAPAGPSSHGRGRQAVASGVTNVDGGDHARSSTLNRCHLRHRAASTITALGQERERKALRKTIATAQSAGRSRLVSPHSRFGPARR